MDLKEEAILGNAVTKHWYYRVKAEALDSVVGEAAGRVLDVGAGAGFFSRHMLERGASEAVCVDPGYDGDWDTEHAGRPLLFRRAAPDQPSDLVLMMDVLEHVDNDVGLAAEYIRAARPGTRVVVTVPAFGWMWSAHDNFLEHRRRYTLTGLKEVLLQAGLRLDGGRYLYGLLLPAAAATRLPGQVARKLGHLAPAASQMHPAGPVVNAVLLAACQLEAWLPSNTLVQLAGIRHSVPCHVGG